MTFYKVIFLKLLALSMKIRGRGSSKKIWNANPVWVKMGWNKFWLRILILSLFLCIFTTCSATVMSRIMSCLEPVCCEKQQKKVHDQLLVWMNRGSLEVLNDIKLILNDPHAHLGQIWHHSEQMFTTPWRWWYPIQVIF